MRVFVAINPTARVQERLWRVSRNLREQEYPLRWAPPENIHLTVKFLGEVDDRRVPEMNAAVAQAAEALKPFPLVASGFGAFPSVRRPQVLWAGIEPSAALRSLHERIETAFEGLGFARERRKFHPHLTLARTKRRAPANDFRGLSDLLEKIRHSDAFEVRAIDVMKSQLTRSGALYDVVHSVPLGV